MISNSPYQTATETTSLSTERATSLFRQVFFWMAGALSVTALTAMFVAGSESFILALLGNRFLFWGLCIAELVLVGVLSARIQKLSFAMASIMLAVYSVLNGVTLSIIFLIFTQTAINTAFFISAGMFLVMAIIGSVTKRNLGSLYSYLIMGVVGLIIASIVNIFLRSGAVEWIISIVGVLLFTVLTAVDVNRIKRQLNTLEGQADDSTLRKVALMGSLHLYLDFINLFLYILRLLGNRN